MELVLGWKDLVYLGSNLIGFLIGILLILFGVRKNKANILIGLSFLFLTYAVFLAFLIDSGYHARIPSLYRTGNIAALLFAPLAYLYIRQVIDNRELSFKDLIHFIPAVIYLIDFFPILFFTSLEEKRQLIQSEIQDPTVFVYFNQSRFFPSNFYTLARTILIVVYWFFSIRFIYRYGKKVAGIPQSFGKEWVIWMKIYVYSELMLFLPFFILARFVDSSIGYDLIHLTGAFVILASGIAMLFFPKVLYGFNEFEFMLDEQKQKTKLESSDYLSLEKELQIQEQLNQVLFLKKKHLQKGYTINELAKDSQVPAYLLTVFINRKLQTNFSDLINQQRIEECCQMMNSGKYKHLTLEGMADLCGFSNRNSFSGAFKKFKGMTPSQFQKTQFMVTEKENS
ncbi:AraC family transcriptional regulator [Algoriphagus lacus]|uniref:AraC family transcriptional regulator n=1 Tax=Algoriphagus lacus TaxID=2056311 RepID=A0A418PLZ1_9BACT|nr:AraC family transcriptional regulator [Algoriphagus lacus]RIW12403.1 AraC family transcriptional regulator [Algoriphagus lacus]